MKTINIPKLIHRIFNATSCVFAAAITILAGPGVKGAPVIDPTGVIYTGVSASSSYSGSYGPSNLFSFNLTGINTNTILANSAEWATAGAASGYVAFQLDNTYIVSSLLFAERNSNGQTNVDQMNVADIWTSTTTPFDPNNPPITQPDTTITLNPTGTPLWLEYPLASSLTGKYFLIEFTDTNGANFNPGGNQLRLGGMLSSVSAPYFTQLPQNSNLYVGSTARFSAYASDGNTAPLDYQWFQGATPLGDGGRVSGSTTPNLQITGLVVGDAGTYTCQVTNSVGSTNAAVTLTVVATPTDAVGSVILSNNPNAYWRLDESPGATVAVDYAGGNNGSYGVDSILGTAGPLPPTFPGFYAGNQCLETTMDDAASVVTAPALNLNTNTVTIVMWINGQATQDPYASLLVWRSGSAYGLLAYGGQLSWIWNDVGWYETSGLVIPTNEWCLSAMVVTPTNTTLYLGSQGAINKYVSANSNTPAAFNSSLEIGDDTGTRAWNGLIDDVAIFSSSLSEQQIQAIYAAGVGEIAPRIAQSPSDTTHYVGGTAHFNVVATGSSVTYQWMYGATALNDGGNVSGSQTANLTITNVSSGNTSSAYSCVVSNSLGSVTSGSATLTLIPAPTNSYDATVLSYNPEAYWKLNDPTGSTNAQEYWGGFTGTVLPDAILGVAGPQSPAFPGFAANNTGVQITEPDGQSTIGVPALNLNSATATVLMWIYPIGGGPGTFGDQEGYCSLWANRSGGYSSLNYLNDGTDLSFQWDSYGWDSGIAIPSDQWELLGMTITPTNTTVYLGTNGVLTSASEVIANPAIAYNGPGWIGCDTLTRVFNGVIDDVAFFNRSLSTADVTTIYNSAVGLPPPPPTLNWSFTPSGLVLNWYGPFTLMQANAITGPWIPANITSGATIPFNTAHSFYRLKY